MATALNSAEVYDRALVKIFGHRAPRAVEEYGTIQNQVVRSVPLDSTQSRDGAQVLLRAELNSVAT